MRSTTLARLPELPARPPEVVGSLPAPFARSLVDHAAGSVAWWRDGWVASVTTYGGRDLAHTDGTRWTPVPAQGWARRPLPGDDGTSLACYLHAADADTGRVAVLGDGGWRTVRDDVEMTALTDFDGARTAVRGPDGSGSALDGSGRTVGVLDGALVCHDGSAPVWSVALPEGATVTLVRPSPSRERVLVVVRAGSQFRTTVLRTADGRSTGLAPLRETLQPVAAWLDEDRVVLVRETWPALEPVVWDVCTGRLETVWPSGTAATTRSLARSPHGEIVHATSAVDVPRRLFRLDDAPPPPPAHVRTVVLHHGDQLVPCVVLEPASRPRATCLVFPGGPHEPVWAEYAPLADVLVELGWRVVKVNVRSSGIREGRFRPHRLRYGVDDVADACHAAQALGVGPVVTLGMSYGGYIASSCAERVPGVVGAVVLAGFLSLSDIAGTRHDGVRRFTAAAFADRHDDHRTLTVPHFVAHGELDRRIPVDALERHARAGPVAVHVLSGEGHGIHTDAAARAVYPALLDWMERRIP